MPVTQIDPKTALIVIDLQKGIAALPLPHPIDPVVKNSAALAGAFRAKNLPVVLVNVDNGAPGRTEAPRASGPFPPEFTELLPELNPGSRDHFVTKRTWGAFTGTGLEAYLKGRGVTQVVITGVATSIGVESTARQAHEAGFNVTLAIDAMMDRNPDAHANSIANIFPRLGETGTTAEILERLAGSPA
jgi:nicotinamidase-related amidase